MSNISRKKQALNALLRSDLTAFIEKAFREVSAADDYLDNWHISVMADALMQCYAGQTKRLIINIPPRNLKSICGSIAFPAWVLGKDPTRRIISVNYSAELAGKFARECRSIMQSRWYRQAFPQTTLKRNVELDLETDQGGARYAASVGGSLTGRGGDIIVIDDPIKPEENLSDSVRKKVNDCYDGTLYSRLNSKRDSVIILIMQRLHMADLVAHVQDKEEWKTISLSAIAETNEAYTLRDGRTFQRAMGEALHPEREPLKVLEKIKTSIGEYNFSAQYQQRPIPPGGNLIQWSWFQFYDGPYQPDRADNVVQSWDTASKSTEMHDYSVCLTFLVWNEHYYILDVYRKKVDFPGLKEAAIRQAQKYKAKEIVIEDTGSGTALIQTLKDLYYRLNIARPRAITPRGEKIIRMASQCDKIREGRVHLDKNAPWLEAFHEEIMAFPYSKHDDQIDALSQFLYWIDERNRNRAYVVPLLGA